MSKGNVLIIDADEWETALLEKSLREAGFEVSIARAAREGLTKAKALLPDCIVCDVELPDIDGYWVAQRVRNERSRVATIPFLFLTAAEDQKGRLMGLSVGADIFMTKPVQQDEIVAQVSALLDMAARLRSQQAVLADTSPPSRRAAAFRGDLAQLSLGTVLTMLELERRAGLLKLESPDAQAIAIEVSDGTIVSAKVNGELKDPIELLRGILALNRGTFWFRTLTVPIRGKLRIGMALLEASRQEDEANH
ncbi:MAG: response regulator [Polyangiaceae bacterium]|nr:response regulator [Polyangiaceae bacterium]